MKKVVNYILVSALNYGGYSDETTRSDLERKVSEEIKNGFEPVGGVCVQYAKDGNVSGYIQAMIKNKDFELERMKIELKAQFPAHYL